MRNLVIVTGAPATGKSSIAQPLAERLGFAFLAKDHIKEALGDAFLPEGEQADLAMSRAVGEATYHVLWAVLPHLPDAVVDCNFAPDERSRSQLLELHPRPVEVFCACDMREAMRRYEERADERHPVHIPEMPPDAFEEYAEPVGVGPVLKVDTDGDIDIDAIVRWVEEELGSPL